MNETPPKRSTHEMATLNAVVAALAVLTGEVRGGVVRADVEFRPGASPERTALIFAAAAAQREVRSEGEKGWSFTTLYPSKKRDRKVE